MKTCALCIAMAMLMAACAGDTGAAPFNPDTVASSDLSIPPGADSPYPPDDSTPIEDEDVSTTPDEPDTGPTDPCAEFDWIKAGTPYQCTYSCGGAGPCVTAFAITEDGECGVKCDPQFYVSARNLGRDGSNMIYNLEDCPAVCTPVQ